MTSFVAVVMLLAFLMGLGYTGPGHLSKNQDGDPWEEVHYFAKVSQDPEGDPWSEVEKSPASQKEFQASEWNDDCW